ncbi:MAG: alpha/beta hydrolase [Acidimicrobiaceae bacterium]|nr:alpha/beta hydrolase [Acidimicrobiaceae bacterium]
MPIYERGQVRIRYEDTGSGFPLLILPGGGLNATIAHGHRMPFDASNEFSGEFRCIVADLRNANGGESSGPLEVDRPWDSYTDDQLGLLDHLGVERFMVVGFCIGGPMIGNLLRLAPERVVAGVVAQPVGFRPEEPTVMIDHSMDDWGPALLKRPGISDEMVQTFLKNMYASSDFLFTVTRDFIRSCETPLLVLPDDVPAHPLAVAMETGRLAPNGQISLYPWKEPPELIPLAVRHVRMFLRAHLPTASSSPS